MAGLAAQEPRESELEGGREDRKKETEERKMC